jgi:hypothetical protein
MAAPAARGASTGQKKNPTRRGRRGTRTAFHPTEAFTKTHGFEARSGFGSRLSGNALFAWQTRD